MSLRKTACLAAMLMSLPLVVPAQGHAADNWDRNFVSEPDDDGIVSSSGTEEAVRTETPDAGVYNNIYIGNAQYKGEDAGKIVSSYNKGILQAGVTAESTVYGGRAYYDGPLQSGMAVEADGNTLVLQKGSNAWGVYGADAYDPTTQTGSVSASNNTVVIEGGYTLSATRIYGAYANSNGWKIASTSVASGNTVIINEGVTLERTPIISGGTASDSSAEASGNKVYVYSPADSKILSVWAGDAKGWGGTCKASNNVCELVLGDTEVTGNRFMKTSGAGEALNQQLYHCDTEANANYLHVTGGTFSVNLFSGLAYGSGSESYSEDKLVADGNTAVLDDVLIYKSFACGYAGFKGLMKYMSASGNAASLTGCSVQEDVYGGCASGYSLFYDGGVSSELSTASENELSLSGCTAGYVYGGSAFSYLNAVSSGNRLVKIEDTFIVSEMYGGYARGTSAQASGNTGTLENVTFSNEADASSANAFFAGGRARATETDGEVAEAVASSNSFEINGGTLATVYGGRAEADNEGTADAHSNELVLNDAAVLGELYGGYAVSTVDAEADPEAESGDASVTKNTIVLNGGSFKGDIYAGYALVTNSTAEASGNVVMLGSGTDGRAPDLEKSTIYGGYACTAEDTGTAQSSGNALVFSNVAGMKAVNIKNFEALSYEYTEMYAGDVILELSGTEEDRATSIAGASVTLTAGNLYGRDGGEFMPGDTVVLLKNASGIDAKGMSQDVTATMGATLLYDAVIESSDDGTEILLTSRGAKASPGTKAVAEGAAAGLALAGEAANAAIESLRDFSLAPGTITPFMHVQASSMRHETGSYVNVSSVSLVAGLGTGIVTGAGNVSLGGFFEYGKGSYTTHNSFDSRSDVDGDGTSWYMGGGILAKMDFKDTGPGHFYAEGSAHMGTVHNEYDSNDLTDFYGNVARFDMDSPYYSLHGGLGYVWNMGCGHDLDIYGKYIWTRVQGTDDTLTTGDKFEADDMDSNRIRLGVRYSYTGNELFKPYIGLAYEHEFAGSCDSTVYGHPVPAPGFEGSSGMGELGIAMKPTDALPLSFSLGVQGYVGQKQGISGSCSILYEF